MKKIQKNPKLSVFASKKANSILDTIFFAVIVVVIGIVGFFAYYLFSEMNADIQSSDVLNPVAEAELQALETSSPTLFDGIFILVVVGVWIAVIAFSYFIEANPLLYGLIFIIGIAMVFVAISFAEWAQDIESDPEFIAISSNMPLTFAILTNFPIYIIVILFSAVVTLFAKESL
jgi:hypothetical protein